LLGCVKRRAAVAIVGVVALGLTAGIGDAAVSRSYPNCKALNARYPHGVGRWGAKDRTKSGDPVTNFKRSNLLYRQNSGLDRDKDGVACEKH
jgi:hypothetical protein